MNCVLLITAISGCNNTFFKNDTKKNNTPLINTNSLENQIIEKLTQVRSNLPSNLRLIILSGRVLVVGYVQSSKEHIATMNTIWSIKDVLEVIDHLELETPEKRDGFPLTHALIKTQIDAKFIAHSEIRYSDFQYVLFKQNIYVLGCSPSTKEKQAFFQLLKSTPSIKKVFFYDIHKQ